VAWTLARHDSIRLERGPLRCPQTNYPQGSFSDRPGPHYYRRTLECERQSKLIRHRGSLGHTFVSGSLVVQDPISLPFALTLFSGFLTRMRKTLGTLDSLSRVYRPSQTAHLTVSPSLAGSSKELRTSRGKRYDNRRVVLHLRAYALPDGTLAAFPGPYDPGATLPPTLYIRHHTTTSDCSKVPWGLRVQDGLMSRPEILVPLEDS
jgi:hypothetical protein